MPDVRLNHEVEEWRPTIYRWCCRLCHNTEDAADATQDVLLTLTKYRRTFRSQCRLGTWLFRIACQYCRPYRAFCWRDVQPLADDLAEPLPHASTEFYRLWLRTLLARLPPTQREAVWLVKALGYANAEAAAKLGVSEATSRRRLAAGLANLRTQGSEEAETDRRDEGNLFCEGEASTSHRFQAQGSPVPAPEGTQFTQRRGRTQQNQRAPFWQTSLYPGQHDESSDGV